MTGHTSIKEALEVTKEVQNSLELIAADLIMEDKPYGLQVSRLAKKLDDVIVVMTVEANMHEMTKVGK